MSRYENYISTVMCANCRKKVRIKIPRETLIEDVRCTKCGLYELHRPSYFGIEEEK